MRHLELGSDDSMLVITSAGDNALHYAIAAQPKTVSRDAYIHVIAKHVRLQIHCVDMNPWYARLPHLLFISF
jgi:betaine lipid synthase